MKTGFAISTFLSGIVFAALVGSMETCSRSMVLDPQGKLVEPMPPDTPPAAPRKTYTWEQLHPFEYVQPRILPGDRLDYFETHWTLPYLARVEKQKLIVTRDGEEVLIERNGDAIFWISMAGASLIPFAVWSVIAIWIVTVPPKRQKLESP